MMKLVEFERTDFKILFQYKFLSFREWRLSIPDNRISVPLHSDKVTVWCWLNSTKVFGPYFFEDSETGSVLTFTKECYTTRLMENFPEDSEEANIHTILMQDGAPAHTSGVEKEWLEIRFPGRLISNKSDYMWPPRFPDLSPLDFSLWGSMEEEIHRTRAYSIAEVKKLIQNSMASIS